MSADWYFLKSGFFYKHKKIGPICELELLKRIEKGEVMPDTPLYSDSKTRGHWVAMRDIKPAFKHWKQTHPDSVA